jgi:hypothetical protein
LNFSSFACVLSFPSIGVFSLQISCNQVDFGPSFVDFQAIAYPTLIQCVPSSASVLGGQLVTVVGQNLFNPQNSTIFCKFYSRSMEPAVFSSDSSVVCVVPELLMNKYSVAFALGGTSFLIVVNVVIDTFTQIQTHLFSSRYEGLVKKMKLKER